LTFWQMLLTSGGRPIDEVLSRACLLLAGGGFSQAANERGAWKDFSIWGGYPMNRGSGDLQPLSLEQGLDSSERGIAAEYNPGLRLVMDRTLRSDWFIVVRHAGRSPEPAELLAEFRERAKELGTAVEARRLALIADVYEALGLIRGGAATEGAAKLKTAYAELATPPESPAAPSGGLAGLAGAITGTPTAEAPAAAAPLSDDELFFQLAAETLGE
jgi:hypothetical protein